MVWLMRTRPGMPDLRKNYFGQYWAISRESTLNSYLKTASIREGSWRFRRAIHVVDSPTIQLIAKCMNRAEASGTESGAKEAPGSGFEVISSEFCHREPNQGLRSPNGVGSLRADSCRRNRRFRQSIRGLCPSASPVSKKRDLG